MTSTVEWHRYGDKQPEELAWVVVALAYPVDMPKVIAAQHFRYARDDLNTWLLDNEENDDSERGCNPDDLWCYLPTPPNGGEE